MTLRWVTINAPLTPTSAHLHDCMEEGQHIHQWPEGRVGAVCQHILTDLAVALVHVEAQPIGRLSHNLRLHTATDA